MDKLFLNNALDVFYTSIQMKKNRPGVKLSVICLEEDLENIYKIIFKETSTIGIRMYEAKRKIMDREIIMFSTSYGDIRVKKCSVNNIIKYYPEYEDCKKIATENSISLSEVYDIVNRNFPKN